MKFIHLSFFALLFLLSACASDQYLMNPGHSALRAGQYDRAANFFAKDAAKPSTNQLLFMLDEGSALFALGRYQEAINIFLKAEDVAAIKDYTSISEEVGTLATSSNIRGYTGEDFEKVLINVYLALSYAALNNVEDAQVEARKINLILYKMIHEGKRNYEESPFARYLSAILWEMNGSINDAYVDYRATYELDSSFPDIGKDLLGVTKRLHFMDDYRDWTEKFPKLEPRSLKRDEGELVVVFEKGLSPVKVPRYDQNSNLPRFIPRYSQVAGAKVRVDNVDVGSPQTVVDIEHLSIRYLEDRINRMAAAKVAGTLVKGAIAAGVGKATDNKDLGWITFYLLQATDRADLRCWRSLPGALQLLRLPMKGGTYQIALDTVDDAGHVIATKDFGAVDIKAGKKRFLVGR